MRVCHNYFELNINIKKNEIFYNLVEKETEYISKKLIKLAITIYDK